MKQNTPDIATGTLASNYNIVTNRWEQEIWIYIRKYQFKYYSSLAACGLEHVTTLYVEKRPVIYDVVNTDRVKTK